jgi:phosphate transport system protein
MTKHFQKELEGIKKHILTLGYTVEEIVRLGIAAVETRDADLAERIIREDFEIDDMEVEIEEECLKILALHQPVAVDLRFLIIAIKINNDLERIGDEVVNIAERVKSIANRPPLDFSFDYSLMGQKAQKMLKLALDALVGMDDDLAWQVVHLDDEVDHLKNEAYDRIKLAMSTNPSRVGYLINLWLISRHIERMADHASNIAEEVIHLVEGEIIRHAPYGNEQSSPR